MNDDVILKLYSERSEEAIKLTDERYRGMCFSVAFSILRDGGEAEECVNDVLLAAWSSIPPTPDDLAAYLAKLTRNRAISMLRARGAQKRGRGNVPLIIEELSECVPDPRAPHDPCDDMVLRDVLRRFVSGLPQPTRAMFVRRYWYSYSLEEVAHEFGLSKNTVGMRLMRARKKLKKMLEKEGVEL